MFQCALDCTTDAGKVTRAKIDQVNATLLTTLVEFTMLMSIVRSIVVR